ncbi:MAG: helix-turn-helix transcriptional regulator [Pseudomonadota bacterium]
MSDAVAIGTQLLAARERLGLSLPEVAASLHVDVAVIESLEAGRFFALGAPVFARGYLRHYAELLGEPLDDVTGRYHTLREAASSPDITAVPYLPPPPPPRARWPLVLLAIVLVLAVLIWWAMGVKRA